MRAFECAESSSTRKTVITGARGGRGTMRKRSVTPEHIELVRVLANHYEPAYDASWLPDDPSMAFLVCVGMGPWEEARRMKVAREAVERLVQRALFELRPFDLGLIKPEQLSDDVYPLEWQNRYLSNLVRSLNDNDVLFSQVFDRWMDILIQCDPETSWRSVVKELFAMCGAPEKGTKTLWLYARDGIGVYAFPIDRRVKARLKQHGLPADSWYMTEVCVQAGIDARELARGMFYSKEDERQQGERQ